MPSWISVALAGQPVGFPWAAARLYKKRSPDVHFAVLRRQIGPDDPGCR
jgi:hypothetical protein